ncbi:MAG: outer membrane beta-barrel protein [Terriglobales bacterium]
MRKLTLVSIVVLALATLSFASDVPKAEVFGGFSLVNSDLGGLSTDRVTAPGWGAAVTGNFNRFLGVKGEISGVYKNEIEGVTVDSNMYNFLFGPQLGYRAGKVRPFAHALFGVSRIAALGDSETAFAMAFGGGLDVKVTNLVSVRLGQADLLHTRFFDDGQNHFRYQTGIVLNLGSK